MHDDFREADDVREPRCVGSIEHPRQTRRGRGIIENERDVGAHAELVWVDVADVATIGKEEHGKTSGDARAKGKPRRGCNDHQGSVENQIEHAIG